MLISSNIFNCIAVKYPVEEEWNKGKIENILKGKKSNIIKN